MKIILRRASCNCYDILVFRKEPESIIEPINDLYGYELKGVQNYRSPLKAGDHPETDKTDIVDAGGWGKDTEIPLTQRI